MRLTGRILLFVWAGLVMGGCDDSGSVDPSLPQQVPTVLPRSYEVDVQLAWSDCDFEGWTLGDGRARAVISQEKSVITWTQTGLTAAGAERSGNAWEFKGALCPRSGFAGDDPCLPAPAFEPLPIVDAGLVDGGVTDGAVSAPMSNTVRRHYLRMTARSVERLSFGDTACRVEILIPRETEDPCARRCDARDENGASCSLDCQACTRCDAVEFEVKPCSCDVTHTYFEAGISFEEACGARQACTIGMVLSARGAQSGCRIDDEEACPTP